MKMFGDAGGGVKFANISAADYSMHLYNAAVLQSRCTQRRATFQRWQKEKKNKNRKEKIPKEAFTSRPMSRRNRLEDFSFRFRGMCRFNDLWNLKKSQRSSGYYLRNVNWTPINRIRELNITLKE